MDREMLNRAVVGRWLTSFWGEAFDLAIVDELCRPDVVLQYAMQSRLLGPLAVKAFMADFRAAFPDLHFRSVGPLISDRDYVVVRWECGGTHVGVAFHDFNIGPLPARSGHRIVLSGHSAVRLEDGLIAEEAIWSTERRAQLRPVLGGLVLSGGRANVVPERAHQKVG